MSEADDPTDPSYLLPPRGDAEISAVEARRHSIIKTRGEKSEITMGRIGLECLCGLMVETPPSYVFPNQTEVSFGVAFDPGHPHPHL